MLAFVKSALLRLHDVSRTEVRFAPIKVDSSDAPYLVDFVREELLKDFTDDYITNSNLRVYTSLNPVLQRAAVEAVQNGLKFVQMQIGQRKRSKDEENLPGPQAALIALDPHTGEIKAMVGGADYGTSQYNRISMPAQRAGEPGGTGGTALPTYSRRHGAQSGLGTA